MALATPLLQRMSLGSETGVLVNLNWSGAYTTGGQTLAPNRVGLAQIRTMLPINATGVNPFYNSTTGAVQLYEQAGTLTYTATGSLTVPYSLPNIRGAANTPSPNTDQAALPTNGAYLAPMTTFAALGGTITPSTQLDCQRNVAICIENDSGGALDLVEGTTTFLVSGIRNGVAATEPLALTSDAGNKSVADTKFRYIYGSQVWDSITNVTITNGPNNLLKCSLGLGCVLGIPFPGLTPGSADFLMVTKNGAAHTLAGVPVVGAGNYLRVLFDTTLADADSLSMLVMTPSGSAGTVDATSTPVEMPNGSDLTGLTQFALFIGK